MHDRFTAAMGSLILTLMLPGCTTAPQGPEFEAENQDRVARIKADAALDPGLIQVRPLSGPEVERLLDSAAVADQQGDAGRAQGLIKEALELAPDNPVVWQRFAELSLKAGQLQTAIDAAQRSFQLGPQVGELCNRNWLTIAEAESGLGRSAAALDARRQSESCPVRPGERF